MDARLASLPRDEQRYRAMLTLVPITDHRSAAATLNAESAAFDLGNLRFHATLTGFPVIVRLAVPVTRQSCIRQAAGRRPIRPSCRTRPPCAVCAAS